MANNLTQQQRMAVENRGGKLLVSAAAGSGKTKVLVDRLVSYIMDPVNPANIDDFLIITYTKAAAAELRGKISAKLTERLAEEPGNRHLQRQVQRIYLTKISTIHSFCADILREYAYKLDISPDFRVADENECIELQQYALEQLLEQKYKDADANFYTFVDTQGFGRNDGQIADIILKVYNNSRCHLNPQQWLDWCVNEMRSDVTDVAETVWGRYLMEDLFQYLDNQIEAFKTCITRATDVDYMEKPIALFQDTLYQLQTIRNCRSWDDIAGCGGVDYGRLTFSKKCSDMALTEQMKAVRNACKKGLEKKLAAFSDSGETVLADIAVCSAAARGLIGLVDSFAKLYDERKRMRRVLDFSDLEQKTLDLVLGKQRTQPTAVAREIGRRFREVMIDEYQDTNEVQDSIFAALTAENQNCFMVGDVKQSIYQFRLADPDIFIKKYNSYEPAESAKPGEGRKVLLSHNFRSSAGVISAVNDVFKNCMSSEVGGIDYGDDEALREGIPHCALPEPEVELYGICVQEDTYDEEASFTAARIKELLDGSHMVRNGNELRPIKADDIVILLRSPGSVGVDFKYALDKLGISCTTGSGVDLLQTEEISFLRSFLQLISNPMQDIPLIAVLSNRVFGFTANELSAIRGRNKRISFYDSVKKSESVKCKEFLSLLNTLRNDAKFCRLPQLIQRIFVVTRMDCIYSAMPDGVERNNNLQLFYQLASEYDSVSGRDLDRFLDYLVSIEDKGLMKAEDDGVTGSVRIMSIHKSKGLEFPVVFLCGLSRGFNQESLRAPVICDKELGLGLNCIDGEKRIRYPSITKRAIASKMQSDSISEEMRVLYVAMTRARDRLIMTYAVKNLESDLSDIALRGELTSKALFTKEVDCIGAWVLQAAMKRTEAGAFFAIGGNPGTGMVSDHPWKISVVQAEESDAAADVAFADTVGLGHEQVEALAAALNYRYPYVGATQIPSKLTATQLKGRFKDMEVLEGADSISSIRHRNAQRFQRTDRKATDIGNAIHAAMQYVRYVSCGSVEGVENEIRRLAADGLLTPEQSEMVDVAAISAFFTTDIGKKLTEPGEILREFKFSLLDAGCHYFDDAEDTDQILLQGVVDCAIIEDDGIIVVDFKTDRVTADTLGVLQDRYAQQLRTYGVALSKIFEKPIKEMLIYAFSVNAFLKIEM